jgi:hypothetical protein
MELNVADFVKACDMLALEEIHQDLLDLDDGLASYEIDFIEDLTNWDGSFTVGQAEYLEKLQEKLL